MLPVIGHSVDVSAPVLICYTLDMKTSARKPSTTRGFATIEADASPTEGESPEGGHTASLSRRPRKAKTNGPRSSSTGRGLRRQGEALRQRDDSRMRAKERWIGENAARCFGCFKDGLKPIDVVIKLELPPITVQSIWAEYNYARGDIIVSPVDVFLLRSDLRGNPESITTCEGLMDAIRLHLDILRREIECLACRSDGPHLCDKCSEPLMTMSPAAGDEAGRAQGT